MATLLVDRCADLERTDALLGAPRRVPVMGLPSKEAGGPRLVGDDGVALDVRRNALPVRVREGIVLRVPVSDRGPDWSSCIIDDAERERRLAEARERLARLRKRDPGGDVVL